MKKTYDIQDFINLADENGYIPLKVFCNKVFRLNEYAIASSFFAPINKDLHINKEVEDIQKNIRNNIQFVETIKKRRGTNETYKVTTIEGGIFKNDLENFINKTKRAIAINSEKLIEAYDEHFKTK